MESTDFNKNKVSSLSGPTNQLYYIDDKIFGMWGNGIDLYEILKTDTYTGMVFQVQRRWK